MSNDNLATNIAPTPRRSAHSRNDEREFLPAALEIIETPASPVGRAIAATLMLFFVIALVWAYFGHIDIIATAQGRIVPVGRVKVIQPLEAGEVTAIRVRDGDRVREGQILIELDRTVATAERNRVRHDLLRARLDVARLVALRAALDTGAGGSVSCHSGARAQRGSPESIPTGRGYGFRARRFAAPRNDIQPAGTDCQIDQLGFAGFAPPADAPAYEIERTRAAMLAQWEQQASKLAALDQQIAQKAAESESIAAVVAKLKAGLPIIEETAEVREKVMRMQYGNRIAHLDAQLKLTEQRHELMVQERRAAEVSAARQALEWQREQTKAEYARAIMTELAEAEPKAAQFAEDLVKAEKRLQVQTLRAPLDGTVQQLALHTIGGVVTPAQVLMVVVPADAGIEVEAMVLNKDVGFVRADDPAEIKIDTFNFTKYGLLHGRVLGVSQDAILRERSAGQNAVDRQAGQAARTSEPPGQELIYAARVSLDRTQMEVEGRLVDLAPGMAVTVEIKTGERRIVEFLLSPLLRYKQESLRER